MSDNIQKPLKADEIEAMLRSAREMEPNRSDIVSSEPLGPGDVQHLRNGFDENTLTATGWPYDDIGTDELLQNAQQHLAQAMANDEVFTSPFQAAPSCAPASITRNPLRRASASWRPRSSGTSSACAVSSCRRSSTDRPVARTDRHPAPPGPARRRLYFLTPRGPDR